MSLKGSWHDKSLYRCRIYTTGLTESCDFEQALRDAFTKEGAPITPYRATTLRPKRLPRPPAYFWTTVPDALIDSFAKQIMKRRDWYEAAVMPHGYMSTDMQPYLR